MQLRKFIKEIEALKPTDEELERLGLPLSEQDRWNIDVLDEEFNAYDGPIYQMVYCIDTLHLFQGLEQLNKIDSNAPRPFKIWGINSFYNFFYAYNYLNDEIVLLDDNRNPIPVLYCSASAPKFLDCLFVVAQFEKLRLLEPRKAQIKKDSWLEKATKAAGGKKYLEHCKVLIG